MADYSISIIYDRRGVATKEKNGSVEICVYSKGKKKRYATGVNIKKHEWKNGRVVNRLDAHSLNEQIERYHYRRQFIWYYENGFSGFTKMPAAFYEPLLWISKGDTFTFHQIREPYKSTERLKNKITKKDGTVWTPNPEGRIAGDVWQFPVLAGKRFANEKVDHPTQKTIEYFNTNSQAF